MSELSNSSKANKLGITFVLAATLAGLIALQRAGYNTHDSSASKSRTAPIEAHDESSATKLAAHYADEANTARVNHTQITDIRMLNGIVKDKAPGAAGSSTFIFRNLIVLGAESKTGMPTNFDKNGEFLDGAYLGVSSSNSLGNISVTVTSFNTAVSEFIPYDPDTIVVSDIVRVRDTVDGAAMYAYDVKERGPMVNPDGTLVSPVMAIIN